MIGRLAAKSDIAHLQQRIDGFTFDAFSRRLQVADITDQVGPVAIIAANVVPSILRS